VKSARCPVVLPVAFLIAVPGVARAATITVDDSGGQDYTRIQSAVDAASNGDTIRVLAGSYSETVSIDGMNLTLTGSGSGSVEVTAGGSGAALAIDGGGTVVVSGLTLTAGERGLTVRQSTASFDDLVIEGNSTAGNGGGVGIFEGAEVTMIDCVVTSNEASSVYHGGGIYVDAASLVMERCELSDNQAQQGGALYSEAGEIELIDCVLSDNVASSHGGAVRLRDGANLDASGTTLEGNSSSGRGGAVSIEDSDSSWSSCVMQDNQAATGGGAMHLSGQASSGSSVDATITGNVASGAGGAIWAWDHDLVVYGEITDNISPATESGGAIYASGLGLQLLSVTISGHGALNGGAVYASSGSTVVMSSATIEDNQADEFGGGVYSTGNVSVTSSFVEYNSAGDQGGGLYVTGADLTLRSSRLQGNEAGGAGGGALLRSGSFTMSSSGIRENTAAQGGGMCVLGGGSSGERVSTSFGGFIDNVATSSAGGLYVDALASVSLASTELSGNSSGAWGGGLYLLDIDSVSVSSAEIYANSALQGGGFYVASVSGTLGDLDLFNNTAVGAGGGGVLSAPGGALELHNSRVLENTAYEGGGLYISADPSGLIGVSNNDVVANAGGGLLLASAPGSSVVNTIVVGNTGVGIGADDAGHSGTLAYNLSWSNGANWSSELSAFAGSGGNLSTDPLYQSWADDGDAGTEYLALQSSSPARDAGDPSLFDLDGSRSDMGSFGGPSASDGDEDGDGWSRSEGDCDDGDASAHPGATEQVYDGVDNDCDPTTLDDDLDQDGYGHETDCEDEDPSINPGADDEPGDGVDQNCDGEDGIAPDDTGDVPDDTGEQPDDTGDDDDLDDDGYSPPEDCNDLEPAANPGAIEVCDDGFDNDCDGYVDASDADCLDDRDTDCTGCASGGRAPWLALWLLGAVGLVSRRRR
jgi:predicted outer membrane repeat protein